VCLANVIPGAPLTRLTAGSIHRSPFLLLRRSGARVRSRAGPWCYSGRWSSRPTRCGTLVCCSENSAKLSDYVPRTWIGKGDAIEEVVCAALLACPIPASICCSENCAQVTNGCSVRSDKGVRQVLYTGGSEPKNRRRFDDGDQFQHVGVPYARASGRSGVACCKRKEPRAMA
jgi:hypothetical protein